MNDFQSGPNRCVNNDATGSKLGEIHLISKRRLFFASTLTIALGMAAAGKAIAQPDWPLKPVKIIIPFQAGGTADTLGRLASTYLSEVFKQPFVVENRGGAGGLIGSQQVAKAPPDGYTLIVSGLGSHVIAPVGSANTFDAMKDFTHIAMLGGPPTMLVVNASSPIKSLKDFVSYANSQPNGISWGSPGQGTHGHLIGELFKASNKLNMVHLSYKGAGPALTDLAANQTQAVFVTGSSAGALIKAGRLRAVAVTSAKRLATVPDVPTFAESGYPRLTAMSWFSLSGPAGMPQTIVNRLNAEVARAFSSPSVKAKFEKDSIEFRPMDPTAFTAFFQSEVEFWTPYVQTLPKEK